MKLFKSLIVGSFRISTSAVRIPFSFHSVIVKSNIVAKYNITFPAIRRRQRRHERQSNMTDLNFVVSLCLSNKPPITISDYIFSITELQRLQHIGIQTQKINIDSNSIMSLWGKVDGVVVEGHTKRVGGCCTQKTPHCFHMINEIK